MVGSVDAVFFVWEASSPLSNKWAISWWQPHNTPDWLVGWCLVCKINKVCRKSSENVNTADNGVKLFICS